MSNFYRNNRWFAVALIAALAVLPACNLLAGVGASPTPTSAPVEPTAPAGDPTAEPTAPPAETAEPTADAGEPTAAPTQGTVRTIEDCPEATEGTVAYVNEAAGFCFLYPDELTEQEDMFRPEHAIQLVGPPLDDTMEPVAVFMMIGLNGPASGMTAADYEARYMEVHNYMPDEPAVEADANGVPAVISTSVQGRFPDQTAYIVAGEHRYTVTIQPAPDMFDILVEPGNRAWNTVMDSIVFFEPDSPPPFTDPDFVCPQAGEGTEQHINIADGFCFLVPEGWERDETFASGFVGGPVVGDVFGQPYRPNLVMASFGPSGGQTPMEVLEGRIEFIDESSIEETTLGGAPAVVFIDPREPVASRQAMISANGMFYSIVNQPIDETAFPGSQPWVDDIWNSVTGTMQFFTPFR